MSELIQTARRLATASRRRPRDVDLRRAVSTAYYAMFNELQRLCADKIVGASPASHALPEWRRVYRALDHGRAEAALNEFDPSRKRKIKDGQQTNIDPAIEAFCETLEFMKDERHRADYDPAPFGLSKLDVLLQINEAEAAIQLLRRADEAAKRTLAFACIVRSRS